MICAVKVDLREGNQVALMCVPLHTGSRRRTRDFCFGGEQLPCFVRATRNPRKAGHWPVDCAEDADGGASQARSVWN
jgi:hypothetical protein